MKIRSKHIKYEKSLEELEFRVPLDEAILKLAKKAAYEQGSAQDEFSILDIGCGRGEIMKILSQEGFQLSGLDIDPICVKLAERYGYCIQGDMHNINEIFPEDSFNLVISSHSLEHSIDPLTLVNNIKKITKRWLIFAIPNPGRPRVCYYNLSKRDYSNKGHLCCWDHSHFVYFLTIYCGLKIIKWEVDRVDVFPKKYILNKFFKIIGFNKRRTFIDFIETRVLTKYFPYFSSSFIVLCEL